MIKLVHKHNKAIGFVFLFVAVCFAFSGVGLDILQQGGNVKRSAITVNERHYSYNEFSRAQSNLEEQYKKMFGDRYETFTKTFNLNIPQQAADQLVDKALLSQEAQSIGFATDEEAVKRYILTKIFTETPYDPTQFKAILQRLGMTYREFSAQIKEENDRLALINLLKDASYLSTRDLQAQFIRQETQYGVIAASIKTADLLAQVPAPTDEQLKIYYETNATRFEVPAKVSYSYMVLDSEKFEQLVQISSQDLEIYYTENAAKFTLPEQAHIREIKLLYPKESTPSTMADVRAKAKKVYEEALSGAPFPALVTKYSDDLPVKLAGGDRGWIQRGVNTASFDKAVFAIQPGAIAELVETDYGFQIVKVEEKLASSLKPFEQVRAQIETEVRRTEAPSYASAKGLEIMNSAKKDNKSLLEIGGASGFVVKDSSALLAVEVDPEPALAGLTAKVLQLPSGDRLLPALVEVGDATLIVQVKEFKETSIAPLIDVRSKVIESIKTTEAQKLALAQAQALLQSVQASPTTFATTALNMKAKVIGPVTISRANPSNDELANAPRELLSALFATNTPPQVLGRYFPTQDGFLVASVTTITKPEITSVKALEELEESRQQTQSELTRKVLESTIALLKARATIEVDQTILIRQ